MKLAILGQGYLFDSTASINGTLVQLYNLSQGFTASGVEVHYITITKDLQKPKRELLNGVHIHWIHSEGGILEWYSNNAKYGLTLEKIKPDAIYVRGRNTLQYVGGKYAAKHKINYVWGTNGDDSAEFWKNLKRLNISNKSFLKKIMLFPLKALEDIFINKGMKLATTIINQSEHQQKETKKLLGRNGIILPSYFLKTECRDSKENIILWMASLSKNKQPYTYINLIESCDLNGWNAILGGGTTDKSFENQIRDSVVNLSITFVGKVDYNHTFNYYCKSKIFVNTSVREGLPNAYIQSWLSGTVVLTLNHDPNGWMKKYNIGFSAKGDIVALKNKLQELINNPITLQTMSDNAVKFASETFANSNIIEEYINHFSQSKPVKI